MDERDRRDAAPTEPVDVPGPGGTGDVEPDATTLPLPVVAPGGTVPPTPTQPMGPAAAAAAPPRRRHRGRRIVLGVSIPLVILVVLGAVGWFGGNEWARGAVVARVTQDARLALGLSPQDRVDVDVAEPMLPQLAAGELSELTVSVPEAPVGKTTGHIRLHATGVPTRGSGPADSATAEVTMSPKALTVLAGDLGDTVPGSMHLTDGKVAVSLDPSQFLSGVSFTLTLKPSVHDGQLQFEPVGFTVGGASMSADVIRARFGSLAEGILAPRRVCVASSFPAGMTLTGLDVASDALTARFDVDPAIVDDASLQKPGSCS